MSVIVGHDLLGQRVGNYRIVRLLGEGGMGVVYEGIRDDIGSRAAIKVLRSEFAMNAEIAARFFNEAKAANLVEHPGIVKIFDYGQLPSGAAYLAMEYLKGESLHQRLTREKRLSEIDTVRIGRQVATALAAAHAKKVIHRDLKPENILLVPDVEAPSGERAKILDFGIAKLAREHTGSVRTDTSVVMGTPIYMSPEQCKGGKTVGDRADVYALGVILFEMLSGRTPFVAEEPGEYIGMHLFKDPPPIASLVPTLSPKLRMLIDSMLVKDQQRRPAMVVAAMVLRDLSNVSTDVGSLGALVGEANLDAETQPLLTVGMLAKADVSAALLPPAPPVSVPPFSPAPSASSAGAAAKPLPIVVVPTPAQLEALSPIRRTVDPLGDTVPDSVPPQMEWPQPVPALANTQSPTAAAPQPAPSSPGSVAAAARGASSDAVTAKKLAARPVAIAPATDQEATLRPGKVQAEKPVPAGDPAGADLAHRGLAFTPAWQPVQIVAGSGEALEQLPGDGETVEGAGRGRNRRSIGRRLRRLQYRLRRVVLGWVGIQEPDPRSTPPRTQTSGARTQVYATLGALALGLLVVGYTLWPRSQGPAGPAAGLSTGAGTPAAVADGSATASGVISGDAQNEADTSPSEPISPALSMRLLSAQEKAAQGKLSLAFKEARATTKKYDHPASWGALGRYACQLENVKVASEALSHLSADAPTHQGERKELVAGCKALGFQLNSEGVFVTTP